MKSIDKQILEAHERIRRREKISRHLIDLQNRIIEARKEQETLVGRLDELGADLSQPQKTSFLHNIFFQGKKSDEAQQTAYHALFLDYKTHKQTLELLEYEKKVLRQQLESLEYHELELPMLIRMKEKELLAGESDIQRKLLLHRQEELFNMLMRQELEEAIHAGMNAAVELIDMGSKLQHLYLVKRKKISGLNTLLGNMDITEVTQSKERISNLEVCLQKFDMELKDVSSQHKLNYEADLQKLRAEIKVLHEHILQFFVRPGALDRSKEIINTIKKEVHKLTERLKAELQNNEKSKQRLQRKKELMILLHLKKKRRERKGQ